MTYTIEHGRGQTYSSGRPTVYRHDVYPRTSVLAGRPRRTFVDSFATVEAARAAYPQAEDLTAVGGCTHIDVDVLTAGLPEEE